jgi:hypothetical protein
VVVLLIRVDQYVPIVDHLWLWNDGDMTLILLGDKVKQSFNPKGKEADCEELAGDVPQLVPNEGLNDHRQLFTNAGLQDSPAIHRNEGNDIGVDLRDDESVNIE